MYFIKRFFFLYLEVKEMIEFIVLLNKLFCLFLVNYVKCGLIIVFRIVFYICGFKSDYCNGFVG